MVILRLVQKISQKFFDWTCLFQFIGCPTNFPSEEGVNEKGTC